MRDDRTERELPISTSTSNPHCSTRQTELETKLNQSTFYALLRGDSVQTALYAQALQNPSISEPCENSRETHETREVTSKALIVGSESHKPSWQERIFSHITHTHQTLLGLTGLVINADVNTHVCTQINVCIYTIICMYIYTHIHCPCPCVYTYAHTHEMDTH